MKEIEFRGKRLDNGEWVYGYYVPDMLENSHNELIYWAYIREHLHQEVRVMTHHVSKSSVGQFIGLRDRNNNKIFEGDIVVFWGGEYCQGYWEYSGKIIVDDLVEGVHKLGMFENIEVVGNIFDNPDQL